MRSLSKEEKELVLDYYFGCGSEEHIQKAKELIEKDSRAAQLYTQLENTLQILDHVDHPDHKECPDHLAEQTVNKLKLASSAEEARLKTLLDKEEKKQSIDSRPATTERSFWQNIPDVAAVAAVIMIVASVAFPTFNYMRHKAWQTACQAGLGRIGEGIAAYSNDHNGDLPAVATSAGSPWWKVGDQGKENQSNTRHPWLLVKNGYVDGADFTCPGRSDAVNVNYTKDQLKKLHDFPSRKHISYSYIYTCPKRARYQWDSRTALIADRNPIFEAVNASMTQKEFDKLSISDQLRNAMSNNHKKGQVILFYDGSALYKQVRVIEGDDIYTATGKKTYTGCETPKTIKDIFLVP